MTPKALFVAHSASLAGAEVYLLNLLRGMDRDRWQPVVVLPGSGLLREQIGDLGIPTRLTPMTSWIPPRMRLGSHRATKLSRGLRTRVARMVGILEGQRPAIVVSGSLVVVEGALAAALCGIPHVWMVHENLLPDEGLAPPLPPAEVFHLVGLLSHRVIVTSGWLRDRVEPHLARPIARAIPPVVDLEAFSAGRLREGPLRRRIGASARSTVLGCVASLTRRKDPLTFLEVAERVHAERPGTEFVWIGEPCDPRLERRVRRRIRERGLSGFVHLVGFQESIPGALAELDIYVQTSTNESFGIACLEAMAAGLPVVAIDAGGKPEALASGETGFVVPRGDVRELRDRVRALVDDADLRTTIGQNARLAARQGPSLEDGAGMHLEVYEEVLATGGPAPAHVPRPSTVREALARLERLGRRRYWTRGGPGWDAVLLGHRALAHLTRPVSRSRTAEGGLRMPSGSSTSP